MTPQEHRRDEDDREAIDRAFAELVAGYHLTADRPDPLPPRGAAEPVLIDPSWADEHPLFRFDPPASAAEVAGGDLEDSSEAEDAFRPEPAPPLPRPSLPVLFGWVGVSVAAATILSVSFGLPLPSWVGWVALVGFLGGFAVLLTRLPRNRPPGSGDGAVV